MTLKGQGKAQRFFEHAMTLETDECILWPFSRNEAGYGRMVVNNFLRYVPMLACERLHGPCPPGMCALHGPCHNPSCFNPRHLRWGTRRENARDRVRDGTHLASLRGLRSNSDRKVEVVIEMS